ncbi:uncharacterized protein EV420DRAFT_1340135 [Desarmillaria tabescens]|uniref:Uncharacterized protein n=1 Tax=Armillaria tabescens TaxID=1929756 RepID=A0AA39JLF2_ARMTA|nr:uncharacterized protein EV420DRAFT_1340135 [Desarmillaria tabescens]KAK0444921.1 hypothetical protein EV420DRAFT_1340135 [Desarmillaria tabescens]
MQATIAFPVVDKENISNVASKKNPRKRTITTVDGETIDLTKEFEASSLVVEAMKQRIFQLEDELEAKRSAQVQGPPAKRTRTSTILAEPQSVASGSVKAGASKADEKKRKMQLKKIFDRIKKDCKSDTVKFQGTSKTIKCDEVFEQAEFDGLFGGKGVLIQPTPQNKPKSAVTIIRFTTKAQIAELFGDELKALKGNRWTRGGGPSFAKSVKLGACDVEIGSAELNYSRNNMKCSLKFEVYEVGGGRGDDMFLW